MDVYVVEIQIVLRRRVNLVCIHEKRAFVRLQNHIGNNDRVVLHIVSADIEQPSYLIKGTYDECPFTIGRFTIYDFAHAGKFAFHRLSGKISRIGIEFVLRNSRTTVCPQRFNQVYRHNLDTCISQLPFPCLKVVHREHLRIQSNR